VKRLYLETNYLIGQAFEQDPDAARILPTAVAIGAEICLPFNCVQEAVSAIERNNTRGRDELDRALHAEIGKLRTDQSATAQALVASLNQAKIENARLLNDRQNRFVNTVATLTDVRFPQMTLPGVLRAVQNPIIDAAADNLILAVVIDDAAQHVGDDMVFFTRNTRDFDTQACRAALAAAGVDLKTSAAAVLAWLNTP
jgi:hypothetical protein